MILRSSDVNLDSAISRRSASAASYPPDHDMSVWVLGIVMLHRNPFEVGTEVLFHTFHQVAR